MKIIYLKENIEVIWPYFLEYCLHSKPYGRLEYSAGVGSRNMRLHQIRKEFSDFTEDHEVYMITEGDKVISAAFLKLEGGAIDVDFIFGVTKNCSSSRLMKAMHHGWDFVLKKYNKNYLKTEITRNFKKNSFKKWVERYDKRAIIFNDDANSVVWCKSDRMKAKFKVVGANKNTEHLMGQEGVLGKTYKTSSFLTRELVFGGEIYLLDEKSVDFLPEHVLIKGFLSDNKEKIGTVALKFIPQHA